MGESVLVSPSFQQVQSYTLTICPDYNHITSKICVIIASNSRFNLPILAGAALYQWQAIALPDCCLACAVPLITIS
jgi:hypothetical protein